MTASKKKGKEETEEERRRRKRKGRLEDREFNKENLKSCGGRLIHYLMKEIEKEPNKAELRSHFNEILHSIFFLGIIHEDSLTPEDFLDFTEIPEITEITVITEFIKQKFPEPFMKYNTHLPRRTPFSILLDIMQRKYGTKEKVMEELCSLMEKLKFPFPKADRPASKYAENYTLESTVICVCSNSQRTDQYFGASLGCNGANAKRIMINSSCLNTWHEYVSYAVMSFRRRAKGDSLQFHQSMQCQAYFRDWETNNYKEKQPCWSCNKLFSLPDCTEKEKIEYYYGNCAETECLSKLLFNDQFMRENITIRSYTPEEMNWLKNSTRESLRRVLASVPSLSNMNDLLCFDPHSENNVPS